MIVNSCLCVCNGGAGLRKVGLGRTQFEAVGFGVHLRSKVMLPVFVCFFVLN